MRTITLEEHFVTAGFLKATGGFGEGAPPRLRQLQSKLLDIGDGRIAEMDAGGVDVQVLSLSAGGMDGLAASDASSLARDVNDELAAAIAVHPSRFLGFATLAPRDPDSAARELERCVKRQAFVGGFLDGTCDG
jgi:predicted TIM-barrel fold metal-dependent hydrolase